jgi:hypothetical protein
MPFETKILMTIMFFMSVLGFMSIYLPVSMQVLSPFDFVWFGGGIVGVAGACAVATGLLCAPALVIFGVVSMFAYIVILVSWIKLLIFMPIVVVVVYLASRLARGGG